MRLRLQVGKALVSAAAVMVLMTGCGALYSLPLNEPSAADQPLLEADQVIEEEELAGNTIELRVGETVTVHVGMINPSLGRQQEISRESNPAIARTHIEYVANNPANYGSGSNRGEAYLIVEGVSEGETTVRVVECFRASPDETGACYDHRDPNKKLPDRTFTIVVTR